MVFATNFFPNMLRRMKRKMLHTFIHTIDGLEEGVVHYLKEDEGNEGTITTSRTKSLATLLPDKFGSFVDGTPLTAQSLQAWKALEVSEKIERNSQHLQQSVIQWQTLAENPLKLGSENAANHYYVFMHIPKAGGTTLHHILAKNYLPNRVIHANAPEVDLNPASIFLVHRCKPRAILMGHYKRSSLVYQFLGDRPMVHFTMFRDPVKRALSYFNYIRTRPNHPLYQESQDWTLEDYAQSSVKELQNKQTLRLLGDFSEAASQQSIDHPAPLLAEAKRVLEQEFTLFGLVERYSEFLIMAKKMLGWHEIVYLRKNSSNRNKKSAEVIASNTISDNAIQILRERNQLDIELYNFANELFSDRCNKLGIDDDAVEHYKQLSKDYQVIMDGLATL